MRLSELVFESVEEAHQLVHFCDDAVLLRSGFEAVDAGPLINARSLETLGFLNIQPGYGSTKYGTDFGSKIIGGIGKQARATEWQVMDWRWPGLCYFRSRDAER